MGNKMKLILSTNIATLLDRTCSLDKHYQDAPKARSINKTKDQLYTMVWTSQESPSDEHKKGKHQKESKTSRVYLSILF